MRKLVAAAIFIVLGACQTTGPQGSIDAAKPISGTLDQAGDCYFFRTTAGKLLGVKVAEGTMWDRSGDRNRFIFPDGSVAEYGQELLVLGQEIDEEVSCYPTSVIIYRVLRP